MSEARPTTVVLTRAEWVLLQKAALQRSLETGERPSASGILRDLIRRELAPAQEAAPA